MTKSKKSTIDVQGTAVAIVSNAEGDYISLVMGARLPILTSLLNLVYGSALNSKFI
jgi:hypothetical protein